MHAIADFSETSDYLVTLAESRCFMANVASMGDLMFDFVLDGSFSMTDDERGQSPAASRQSEMLEIEVGENESEAKCHCCGEPGSTGHGFVYSGGDARAVYYAAWSSAHAEGGVSFAIAVGEWDDDSTSRDRVCFGLEAYEGEDDIHFQFIDPSESPWPETELMGAMIGREEALDSDKKKEVLRIAEEVIREHPAIRRFSSFSRGASGVIKP